MYAVSPSSLKAFALASSPGIVLVVVSVPRQPTTVVMPPPTISLRAISGVCEAQPCSAASEQMLMRVDEAGHHQTVPGFDDFKAKPAPLDCPDIDVADSDDLVGG